MLTFEGEETLLRMIFQGDNLTVPPGSNFFLGACKQLPQKVDTLLSINTEPSAAGGYARIPLNRAILDFPTIGQTDGETRILSSVKTFSAVGGDFSLPFNRLFICNVASGTAGILIGYSGSYSSDITLLNGQTQDIQFEFYP